jgi:hypothetical protein
MANYNFDTLSAVDHSVPLGEPSTLTDVTFTPTTSLVRLTSERIPFDFTFMGLATAVYNTVGTRPTSGQLYPRGVFR